MVVSRSAAHNELGDLPPGARAQAGMRNEGAIYIICFFGKLILQAIIKHKPFQKDGLSIN